MVEKRESYLEEASNYIVTGIEFQSKDPTRRSIYLNKKYAFGISAETDAVFHIEKGATLSEKQIAIINSHEQYETAKKIAIKYLGMRMRSQKELMDYLRKKGFDKAIVHRVIQHCEQYNYLNDEDFANAFVRDQMNLSKNGVLKIRSLLRSRGITNELIDKSVMNNITREQQLKLALRLAGKKVKSIVDDSKKKREKLYRFLAQKGFTTDVIFEVLKTLE